MVKKHVKNDPKNDPQNDPQNDPRNGLAGPLVKCLALVFFINASIKIVSIDFVASKLWLSIIKSDAKVSSILTLPPGPPAGPV